MYSCIEEREGGRGGGGGGGGRKEGRQAKSREVSQGAYPDNMYTFST